MAVALGALLPIVGKVLDRLIPDKAARAAADAELLRMELSGEFALMQGQLAVNAVEAASGSVFVAGWRPFIGWVCGVGFGYAVLLLPLLSWLSAIRGWPVPPDIDTGTIVTLLAGLLGFGGMRTIEKINSVARSR